jgi:hypothetical protein
VLLLLFTLLSLPAAHAEEFLEDINPRTFDKLHKLDKDNYDDVTVGDRYEWTQYQQPYHKTQYGHRYEWQKPGLSRFSICVEVDSETGGSRYHQFAEDEHCPKFETVTVWDEVFEGQPSRCLRVDKETRGDRWARIVDDRMCAKPQTIFVWENQKCSEVDQRTQGREYRTKAADYLCAKTLDVMIAYGRKTPSYPQDFKPRSKPSRMPASVSAPLELDPAWRETPDELEDGVDHVHRSADDIHHR